MAGGTLPLIKRPAKAASAEPAPAPAKPAPVYDPEMCSMHVGNLLLQGKNYFTRAGTFVREAPKEEWYFLTPEQEKNWRKQMAVQRAKISARKIVENERAVPDKIATLLRENAQALAAEESAA